MKITSLQIKNNFLGWEFDEIRFAFNLTLLVGISGVGKTQILRAIDDLQDIANGRSINGFEWKITFSTISGKEFTWEGAFAVLEVEENLLFGTVEEEEANDTGTKPRISFEKLTTGSEVLIDRSTDETRFNGTVMPKLSSTQSMIHILKEESSIKEVVDAFKQIIFEDQTRRGGFFASSKPINLLKEKYPNLEKIKNSNEHIRLKLFLCSQLQLKVFEDIKSRFIDVFPQVEDIKIEPMDPDDVPFRHGKDDPTIPVIFIKEKDVPKWIREDRMSSGMLRTIVHLGEIFLARDGSVILNDEFENSLGINCIDILTDDLIHENKTLQFIATSHHPYIINNIPYEYWKIVTRKGGHIQIRSASDYRLGKSKQEAFLQLTKILEKQS
jgi:predicted ATPase